MYNGITAQKIGKMLCFCGTPIIPAPLLGIFATTAVVALCGTLWRQRPRKTRNPAPLLGLSVPQPRHRLSRGSVAVLWRPRTPSARLRRRHTGRRGRAMKKKVKKFLRAARNACYHVALFGGAFL